MDVRQLAALVAVADHGSFTAAAGALHTVQSNVSSHVARLEGELGAVLVDRGTGHLTEEGEAVVARARRIQHELDATAGDIAALRDEVRGEVRLGVISTTARWLVPPLLERLARRHPRVNAVVLDASTTSLAIQLASSRLDLGVVNLPLHEPALVAEPLFEEDLVVAVPAQHPLAEGTGARRTTMQLADLTGHDLLLPPHGTALRDELEAAARREGVALRAGAEVDGVNLLGSLVVGGAGPAVLPATALPPDPRQRWRIVRLDGLAPREVGLATRRRTVASAAARAVSALLREVVANLAGAQPGVRVRAA